MKLYTTVISLVFLYACVHTVEAQVVINTLDVETYDEAIKLLFPSNSMSDGNDFGYLIKVIPSSEPEFAVRIVSKNGIIKVTKSESPNGNLFSYFSSLVKSENIDEPALLAKRVKLSSESKIIAKRRFEQLQKKFADKLALLTAIDAQVKDAVNSSTTERKSADVIIHGTTYEIEFISWRNEYIFLKVYDYPLDSVRFRSPMIDWIRDVVRG